MEPADAARDVRGIISRLLAGGRVAIGLALFLAPARTARGWMGDVVDTPGASLAIRGLGARDVAIGVGQLAALAREDPSLDGWLEAGAVADAADAAAAVLARRHMSPAALAGTVVVAGGAAATALWLRGAMQSPRTAGGG